MAGAARGPRAVRHQGCLAVKVFSVVGLSGLGLTSDMTVYMRMKLTKQKSKCVSRVRRLGGCSTGVEARPRGRFSMFTVWRFTETPNRCAGSR